MPRPIGALLILALTVALMVLAAGNRLGSWLRLPRQELGDVLHMHRAGAANLRKLVEALLVMVL